MTELRACLAEARGHLVQHQGEFGSNEAMTRLHIIDPVLEALGWSVRDLTRVQIEQKTSDGRPDYTLVYEGRPTIHVEAKAAGHALTPDDMSQLARYCYNDTGVPYGVLTNGARWVLFDPFLQGRPFAERIICDVDILNTDVDEARDELSLMAYASLAGLRAEIELRTTLSACWEAMWDEATELTRAVAKTLRARIGREIPALAAGLDVERVARFAGARLTSLGAGTNRGRLTTVPSRPGPPTRQHPQRGSKSPRPTESRRPGAIRKRPTRIVIGGNDRPASRAKHVLVETAEWLVGQGDIVPGSDPVTMGATRYIVSNTPRHRNDAHFASPHQLSNGLYLETNYTAAACETRARDLLERFGYAPSSEYLVVEWES